MNSNEPIVTGVPCILCGKNLAPCNTQGQEEINGGVSVTVDIGYGSLHDMEVYSLILCDECISKSYQAGRLKFIRDNEDSRLTKPYEFLTDDERKDLDV
jgi:hypothetical protein